MASEQIILRARFIDSQYYSEYETDDPSIANILELIVEFADNDESWKAGRIRITREQLIAFLSPR